MTLEDLLMAQVMAHEDLLMLKLKALDDLLTTFHDDTGDLFDDTDDQWYKINIIPHQVIAQVLIYDCLLMTRMIKVKTRTNDDLK